MATARGVRVGEVMWVEVEDPFHGGEVWVEARVVGLLPDGSIETTAGRRCDEEVRIPSDNKGARRAFQRCILL
jgi:hypothetical protein